MGEWFYLVNSSFEMFPGVPIHRSRDLVHWLSTEVTGGFIGTYVGLYAVAPSGDRSPAPAAFDWFDYEKHE